MALFGKNKEKTKDGIMYHSVQKEMESGAGAAFYAYIAQMFGCGRVCIFERTRQDTYLCTQEWCNKNVSSVKDKMQELTWIEMMPWIEVMQSGNATIIENVESIKDTNSELYAFLKNLEARSVIAGELSYLGEDLGFWIVANPPLDKMDDCASIFQGLFYLVGNIFHTRDTIEQLKDIGFTDKLTGSANRNALTRDIEHFPRTKSFSLLFVDLNGMKEINDTLGHEAGDAHLINTCNAIREVFPPQSLYRIGGDEFLVIQSGISKNEFDSGVEALRKILNEKEIKVAIGAVYRDYFDGNFEEIKQEADDLMYKDKRSSYKTYEGEEDVSSRPDEVIEVYPQEDGYRVLTCIPHKYNDRGTRAKTGIFSIKLHEYADSSVHPSDKLKYLEFWNMSSLIAKLEKENEADAVILKYRARTVDGFWCWVEEQVTMIRRDNNKIVLISSLRDISDQREREEISENKTSSSEDYVAQRQLYLNRKFTTDADKWLSEKAENEKVIIIACNLGHLRLYNDTFGRDAGDRLLELTGGVVKKAAELLHGISAYLGGDNYCVVGVIPDEFISVEEFAQYIRNNLVAYRVEGGFAPSIGLYHPENKGEGFTTMHDRALIAMSGIKGNYKEHVKIYKKEEFHTETVAKKIHVAEVQEGMMQDEFKCYLQPVVDVESGKIAGCEALARWQRGMKLLKAESFVDVLEDNGYILTLDLNIWRQMCEFQKRLQEKIENPPPCSMNVSAVDFHYVKVAQTLIDLLAEYDLKRGSLIVELSESTYVDDPENVGLQIEQMRNAGIKVFMDDGGGGFDTFRMLYGAGLDGIKMNRNYLDMLSLSSKTMNPIKTLIDIGKDNNLIVVSEGAETRQQLETLKSLGCKYVQGNCYYRPMPTSYYEDIIIKQNK